MQHEIKVIRPTDDGVAFFLRSYKPFRLRALETDPSCFSSTYAREAALHDNDWRQRVLNPLRTTVVAVAVAPDDHGKEDGEEEDQPILSSATLIGPIPPPPAYASGSTEPLHWEVNGVWTAPEARRNGLAQRVLEAAAAYAKAQATEKQRGCLLSVLVVRDNLAALSLYTACGYEVMSVQEEEQEATVRLAMFLPV
ncbi:acyl-CoA N-acyltransferase [Cercophora scortea]|uniref:Acyl-CoA N-acyltransferase n=1 Tax=Cercophora scortea TaxID=314031 RepID=A0AAE0MLT3_9PEZI|nr:acyl-CoA N-acyltransferase [Cercophora scortea]